MMKSRFLYVIVIVIVVINMIACNNKRTPKENWDHNIEEVQRSLDEAGDKIENVWDEGIDYAKDKWELTKENINRDGDSLTHSLEKVYHDTQ